MAASGILLIVVILFLVLGLHDIWRIRGTALILIGSLVGVLIAAIIAIAIFFWAKRYRSFAIQKHAVIFTTPVGDNPTAEIINHTSNIHVCNQSNRGNPSPSCSSCDCCNEPHASQDTRYRSFNVIDEQRHKKNIRNPLRPLVDPSTLTTLTKIEENPIIDLTEDTDFQNYNEFVNENLNQLESSC